MTTDTIEKIQDLFEHARYEFCGFDPITGLVGRVFFDLELASRIYEFERYQIPLCVCGVNLVGLEKLESDTIGLGSLIREIGQIFIDNLRIADRATWYSHSGFALILSHIAFDEAKPILERGIQD